MILQQICHLPVLLTTRLFSPQAVLPNANTYGFIAVHVLKRVANTDGFGEEHNGATAQVCHSSELVWSSASYQQVSLLLLWCLRRLWRLLNFQEGSPKTGKCVFNHNSHRWHKYPETPFEPNNWLGRLGRIQTCHLFHTYETQFLLVSYFHSEKPWFPWDRHL